MTQMKLLVQSFIPQFLTYYVITFCSISKSSYNPLSLRNPLSALLSLLLKSANNINLQTNKSQQENTLKVDFRILIYISQIIVESLPSISFGINANNLYLEFMYLSYSGITFTGINFLYENSQREGIVYILHAYAYNL